MKELVVESKWNRDAKFSLKFSKFCVWPLGLWPFDSENGFSRFRFVYSFVSQVWMIGTQVMAVHLKCGGAEDNVDYVMMAICAIMSFSKIVALRIHMSNIRVILSSAQQDLLSIPDDESRQIMRPYAKLARTVFYVQMVFSYTTNTIIVLGSLPFLIPPMPINETSSSWNNSLNAPLRQLPLQTGCVFAQARDAVYAFLYVYEAITIYICAHGNVGCDVFIFTIAMHLCGQFELLKTKVSGIGSEPVRDPAKSGDPRPRILMCIKRHIYLLELVQALNKSLAEMLVVQLLLNSGMNLMLGIRIIMAIKSGIFATAIRPMFAFNVLMLQLYFWSRAGDELSSQAGSVMDALYDSYWYELSPKLRKGVYFLAMRANKPVHLAAGQIYVINLDNFKNIIKASFSYFSILQAVFDA